MVYNLAVGVVVAAADVAADVAHRFRVLEHPLPPEADERVLGWKERIIR